jgi:hypothetical protein
LFRSVNCFFFIIVLGNLFAVDGVEKVKEKCW